MSDKYWDKKYKENTFAEVVVEFYRALSYLSSITYSPEQFSDMRLLLDVQFELFGGFVPEEYLDMDTDIQFESKGEGHEDQLYCRRKIILISNMLAVIGAIKSMPPNPKDPPFYIKEINKPLDYSKAKSHKDTFRRHVAPDGRIPYDMVVNNHLKHIPQIIISREPLPLIIHIEVLFSILAPYITQSKMEEWRELDKANLDEEARMLSRLNICSRIMDDGNFVWEQTCTSIEIGRSEDLEYIDELETHLNR